MEAGGRRRERERDKFMLQMPNELEFATDPLTTWAGANVYVYVAQWTDNMYMQLLSSCKIDPLINYLYARGNDKNSHKRH